MEKIILRDKFSYSVQCLWLPLFLTNFVLYGKKSGYKGSFKRRSWKVFQNSLIDVAFDIYEVEYLENPGVISQKIHPRKHLFGADFLDWWKQMEEFLPWIRKSFRMCKPGNDTCQSLIHSALTFVHEKAVCKVGAARLFTVDQKHQRVDKSESCFGEMESIFCIDI